MQSIKSMLQNPEVRKIIEQARDRVERYEADYHAVEIVVEALEEASSEEEVQALLKQLKA